MINFAAEVMNRLRLNALEMGFSNAWATAPRMRIERGDMPAAYSLIGGTFAPTVRSRGVVKVSRTYIQRFLLYPFAGGLDDLDYGAEANQIALEWIDLIHFYYQTHERLGTLIEPELRYCEGVISVSDSGLVSRRAPGGQICAALDFSLNIVMAAKADSFSPPYIEDEV